MGRSGLKELTAKDVLDMSNKQLDEYCAALDQAVIDLEEFVEQYNALQEQADKLEAALLNSQKVFEELEYKHRGVWVINDNALTEYKQWKETAQ